VPAHSPGVLAGNPPFAGGVLRVRTGLGTHVPGKPRTQEHRSGIGTRLLARAARAVTDRATADAMFLWVLRQNTAAQHFYRAWGAVCVETAAALPPGGDPSRLNGAPIKLRMAWSHPTPLVRR
jgi:hypothetical protein